MNRDERWPVTYLLVCDPQIADLHVAMLSTSVTASSLG